MVVQNCALGLVREVFETESIKEMAAKLATGQWIVIAALEVSEGHYRFCMGRVG